MKVRTDWSISWTDRSLKHLSIHTRCLADMPFSKLLSAIHHCTSLESLNLYGNISKEDLETVLGMKRLPKPLRLTLNFTPSFANGLTKVPVLYAHPEIILRYPWWVGISKDGLDHIVSWNNSGRYLLDRPGVPESLWPLGFGKCQ
jgi:hypothetical protein